MMRDLIYLAKIQLTTFIKHDLLILQWLFQILRSNKQQYKHIHMYSNLQSSISILFVLLTLLDFLYSNLDDLEITAP